MSDQPDSWKLLPWRTAWVRAERKALPRATTQTDGDLDAASGDNVTGEQQADSTQSTALGSIAAVEEASDASQSRLAQMEEYEQSAQRASTEGEASDERWPRRLATWSDRT